MRLVGSQRRAAVHEYYFARGRLGDIVAYRTSSSSELEGEWVALERCNRLMEQIIWETNASSYLCWIGGSNNFRKEIDPEYKAHRKDKPKPIHLQACREFLVTNWNTKVTDGCETDDMLALSQTQDTIICSIDKDLLQVPGLHYNFVKGEEYLISRYDGLKNFYRGLIIGDVADNIKGVAGLGKVKTERILNELEPNEYNLATQELYGDLERYERNKKLMWLWREEGGTWTLERENLSVRL